MNIGEPTKNPRNTQFTLGGKRKKKCPRYYYVGGPQTGTEKNILIYKYIIIFPSLNTNQQMDNTSSLLTNSFIFQNSVLMTSPASCASKKAL